MNWQDVLIKKYANHRVFRSDLVYVHDKTCNYGVYKRANATNRFSLVIYYHNGRNRLLLEDASLKAVVSKINRLMFYAQKRIDKINSI